MTLIELQSFAVLADQLHFGRAASILNLSQPALTKQIRKIESELGSPLFDRDTHGTQLTLLGAMWLPQVRKFISDFERLVSDGRKGASGKIGRLRIGFGTHTLDLVPQVIMEHRRHSPEVQITLQDMSTREQATALQEGAIDVGFLREPDGLSARYTRLPVVKDRLALVSIDLPDAPASLRLKDCSDMPFVMITPERSPGFYRHVLELCAVHGFHPRIVQEVREFQTAMALVRAGMGVAVIPESLWTKSTAGLHCHRISDRSAAWSVNAVWRVSDSNPVLASFIRDLRHIKTAPPSRA